MITFDKNKIRDDGGRVLLDPEGGANRLYFGLLPQPAKFYINSEGARIDKPAKRGIDTKTCTLTEAINFLADTKIRKSQSQITFIHRYMSVRFPDDYARLKPNIDNRFKIEYEMIQANSKKDIFFIGEVDYSQMVRLDGSITNPNSRALKGRNNIIKIVRK